MSKCSKCLLEKSVTNMILDGKFGSYCSKCIKETNRLVSPYAAQYFRDRDREDHRKDILQPWVNGRINPEFARAYPEQAKEMYSKEELKEV